MKKSKAFDVDLIKEFIFEGDDTEDKSLKFMWESPWKVDGDFDYKSYYFFEVENNKIYKVKDHRTGSPYTDYHYDSWDWESGYISCSEVNLLDYFVVRLQSDPRVIKALLNELQSDLDNLDTNEKMYEQFVYAFAPTDEQMIEKNRLYKQAVAEINLSLAAKKGDELDANIGE